MTRIPVSTARKEHSPFAAWVKRRKLVSRLSDLDNRMLDDIGIQRYQIAEVAEQAFPRSGLKAVFEWIATSINRRIKRAAAARQLASLDDRMLADIGLSRSEILGATRDDMAFRTFAVPNIMTVSRAEMVHSIPDLVPATTPAAVNDDVRPIAA